MDGPNYDDRASKINGNGHVLARTLTGIDFADMQPHLADGHLVKGLLGRNVSVAIIGASGCGKTFFATNLAVHIAAGLPWRGAAVAQGLVIYAALEGPVSAINRFVASRIGMRIQQGIPLRLTPGPVNLCDTADVGTLIEFIHAAEGDHGEKCSAVFIDTLSRGMPGQDENGSEGMGAAVLGMDTIRSQTGATVILVHHLGKDETRGARGHSCLKAALDTEIQVEAKGEIRVATVTKQRDLLSGTQYGFKLEPVELGRDAEGEPVTSCIVVAVDDVPSQRRQPSGKNQAALLAALQEWKP